MLWLCVWVWLSLPGNHKNHNRHQTRLNADLPDVIRSHCNVIAHNLLPPLAHLWQRLWSSATRRLSSIYIAIQPPYIVLVPFRTNPTASGIYIYIYLRKSRNTKPTRHPFPSTPNPSLSSLTHSTTPSHTTITHPKRTPSLRRTTEIDVHSALSSGENEYCIYISPCRSIFYPPLLQRLESRPQLATIKHP